MHAEYNVNGGTIMFGQSGGLWPPFPCAIYLVVEKVDGLYAKGLDLTKREKTDLVNFLRTL